MMRVDGSAVSSAENSLGLSAGNALGGYVTAAPRPKDGVLAFYPQ
jgi:hypothetical protein